MLGELSMISPLFWALQGAEGNEALEMLIFFGHAFGNSSWLFFPKQIHPPGRKSSSMDLQLLFTSQWEPKTCFNSSAGAYQHWGFRGEPGEELTALWNLSCFIPTRLWFGLQTSPKISKNLLWPLLHHGCLMRANSAGWWVVHTSLLLLKKCSKGFFSSPKKPWNELGMEVVESPPLGVFQRCPLGTGFGVMVGLDDAEGLSQPRFWDLLF